MVNIIFSIIQCTLIEEDYYNIQKKKTNHKLIMN